MGTPSVFDHFRFYINKYGVRGLSSLVLARLYSATLGRWEWLYSIDLDESGLASPVAQSRVSIVAYENSEQLDDDARGQLLAFKSELSLRRFLNRWFDRGAVLWLTRTGTSVVGLQWTLLGGMSGMYSVPIGPDELIVVSVEVFPPFRGQGLCTEMLDALFRQLGARGFARAYLKVASSNSSMIRSMAKTKCHRLGKVYTVDTSRWVFCIWSRATLASRKRPEDFPRRAE